VKEKEIMFRQLVALLLFVALPVMATSPSEALLQDAAAYSTQAGVSVDEAVRRLQLQKEIGDLDAALTAEEPATFAGLWIEYQPQFRVVVRFTDRAAEARLQTRLGRGALADLIELRPAKWSIAELENASVKDAATRAVRASRPITTSTSSRIARSCTSSKPRS
jgi:hypothetical protein